MTMTKIILFGALGGCCPTIAKLASFYSSNYDAPLPQAGVYIGLVLFAVLGGIIAMAFGSREVKAAVIAGIAAPGIVTNVVAGQMPLAQPMAMVVNVPEPVETTNLLQLLVAGPAFAQTTPDAGLSQARSVTIQPHIGGSAKQPPLPIEAMVERGGVMRTIALGTLKAGDTTPQVITLPEGTVGVSLGGAPLPLAQLAGDVSISVQTTTSFRNELLWALGGERQYDVQGITVTPSN